MTELDFLPDITDPEFAPFWQGCREERLLVQCCSNGHRSWPPRPLCPQCHDATRDWVEVGTSGSLYSWTVVHKSPLQYFSDQTPYIVAVVELCADPVLRILGRCLADPSELHTGMLLQVQFEPMASEIVLPIWRPVEEDKRHEVA